MDKRRISGATICLAWIGGFGREIFTSRPPGEALKIVWEIISPPSFYLAMVILGIGGFVYFAGPWINSLRPSVKLATLHNDIEEWTKDETGTLAGLLDTDATRLVSRQVLRRKLARIGISLSEDRMDLRAQLPALLLCAKEGDIDAARRINGG